MAEGPGAVSVLENFMRPWVQYATNIIIYIYENCSPILQSSGKIVGTTTMGN